MKNTENLAPVIAFANHKGGVAKTTSVVTLSAELGRLGCNVLVIDLDPQGNASSHIGSISRHQFERNAINLLTDRSTKKDKSAVMSLIQTEVNEGFDNVFYIPAAESLDAVAESLRINSNQPSEELRARVNLIRDLFDVILIDSPPSLGLLTGNAISAATHYLIPVDTSSEYSKSGLLSLNSFIQNLKEDINPDLSFLGCLLTRHSESTNTQKAIANEVRQIEQSITNSESLDLMLPVYIRNSMKVGEASIHKKPIRKIARSNNVTLDYEALAKYLVEKLALNKTADADAAAV